MSAVSVSPSPIHVRMIEDGWLESNFDTTYPLELRGIISESEYQESINKINRAIQVNKVLTIFCTIVMCTVIGTICSIIALLRIKSKRMERLKEAVAEESSKYSSRSPIPCRWRLDLIQNFLPERTPLTVICIAIDIVRDDDADENRSVVDPSNQVISQPATPYTEQINNAPPPYSTGSCSYCGTARQDITAKFCSSCGHAHDKY
ncbi:unnamed protein product [Adineta steineri]|uniref:Golgin subfamily A member 7/ERF4 domain-containing protein n=2 Tax=Adineta steineri TaxID=433720 RepID=A0A813P4L0_9BILA|nr:unnamed protein product [Adineta steineri]